MTLYKILKISHYVTRDGSVEARWIASVHPNGIQNSALVANTPFFLIVRYRCIDALQF